MRLEPRVTLHRRPPTLTAPSLLTPGRKLYLPLPVSSDDALGIGLDATDADDSPLGTFLMNLILH